MLFDVTFSDGTVRTLQAHNKEQLEMALQNVAFRKIIPSEQVSQETEKAFDALESIVQERVKGVKTPEK